MRKKAEKYRDVKRTRYTEFKKKRFMVSVIAPAYQLSRP